MHQPVPADYAHRALANTPGDEIPVRHLAGPKLPQRWLPGTWERHTASTMIDHAELLVWNWEDFQGHHLGLTYVGRQYWLKLERPYLPPPGTTGADGVESDPTEPPTE